MMWLASLPARALMAGVTLLTLAVAACTPPERGAAGSPPPVYVLHAGDGTVSALDGWASPARPGMPDPQGRPPAMASGPAGSLLYFAAGSAASATAAAGAADGERSSVGAAG